MKVYNQDKTQILTEYNLNVGYLVKDTIFVAEVPYIKEEGHYETIREYENGGKDVEWVVDVKGQEYVPEHYEDIYVYKQYTAEELQRFENIEKIEQLKQELEKWKEDVEQVELFGMERTDYEQKKARCAEIILELRELEKQIKEIADEQDN